MANTRIDVHRIGRPRLATAALKAQQVAQHCNALYWLMVAGTEACIDTLEYDVEREMITLAEELGFRLVPMEDGE